MTPFSEMVREARARNGYSQRELAQRVGVSQPFVVDVEAGAKMPAETALDAWARALHLRPEVVREVYANTQDLMAGPNKILVTFAPGDFVELLAYCREHGIRPADFLCRIGIDVVRGRRPLKPPGTQ